MNPLDMMIEKSEEMSSFLKKVKALIAAAHDVKWAIVNWEEDDPEGLSSSSWYNALCKALTDIDPPGPIRKAVDPSDNSVGQDLRRGIS